MINLLDKIMTKVTTRLAFVFLFFLTVTSLLTMVKIAYVNELTTLSLDPIGPILAAAIYYLISYKFTSFIKSTKKLKLYFGILILIYCLTLVLFNPIPYNDQGAIARVLAYLNAGQTDVLYADYLRIWSGQYKLIMIFQLLGSNHHLFFVLNTIGYVVSYFLFVEIAKKISADYEQEKAEKIERSACITYATFIPLALYTHFYYGESLSISLFWLIIYSLINFYKKTETLKDYIIIPIAFGIAYLLRDYTLIFLIAVSLVFIIKANKENLLKRLIVILTSWLIVLFSSSLVDVYFKSLYDFTITNHNSHLTWVVMGMMDEGDYQFEKDMIYCQEGGHNAYNYEVVINNDFDKEAVHNQAKADLKAELLEFAENPVMAVKFFFNKMSKQWTEANFAGNVGISYIEEGSSPIIIWLYTSFMRDGYDWFVKGYYCFMMMSLILYLKNNMNHLSEIELTLVMFFVGGFLFSSFWEAKPRYNLPYYTMLMPLFSISAEQLCERIEVIIRQFKEYLKAKRGVSHEN